MVDPTFKFDSEIWTLLEMFHLAMIEEYVCPGCVSKLDHKRHCTNPRCQYDCQAVWLELDGPARDEDT